MYPTIKDVAKKAEVSTATVSLVINNSSRISRETIKKVQKIIKELNYFPSRAARGLVSRKTGNIVFILTSDHFLRTEPFYTKIFLGTEFEASQNKYYILLSTINSNYKKNDPLPLFILERSVEGIILSGKIPEAFVDNLIPFNLPMVFVDYYPEKGTYPVILIDNVKGGMIATQHLIELGHKNIGFIGGDINHPSIADRLHGFKMAFKNADLNYSDYQIVTDEDYPDRHSGYSAAKKIFSRRKNITAIFACNDAMAIGAMQYLKDHNYKIPKRYQ